MKLKPRFSLALLLLLCTGIAFSIAGVIWLRTNIIIRSPVSGTLVGRDGERYPINRWFHQPMFNPSNFYDDGFPLDSAVSDSTSAQGTQPYSVLETSQGKFRANVKLWRYEGSSADSFRVELTVDVGASIH